MNKEKQAIWIMGLLPSIVGAISICGWIFGVNGFLTLIPNMPPIQPATALLTLICGGIFLSFSSRHSPLVKKVHGVIGFLMAVLTTLLLTLKFFDAEYLAVAFGQMLGLFNNSTFKPEIVPIVWFCWGAIGTIIILLSTQESRMTVIVGEALTMFVLFLAIFGFIISTSRFEILYTWINAFSMPAGTSLSFIAICISLISVWSRTRRYQNYFTGLEDRKIIGFSGALLIQSAITAGLICFTTLAKQNERFLKTSLEQYLNLKVNVFKTTIENEIDEVDEFKKHRDFYKTVFIGNKNAKLEDLKDFLKAHKVANWQIIKKNGDVLHSNGKLNPPLASAIPIPKRDDVTLFFNKKWLLFFNIPILHNNTLVGHLRFEYPLSNINSNFWTKKSISDSEEQIICKNEPNADQLQCFSSLNMESMFNISVNNKSKLKESILTALQDKSASILYDNYGEKGALALFKPVPDYNVLMILKISTDEIYDKVLGQFKLSLPLLLWFIFFSLVMLNWQVTPLFRKVVASEKDAIENARLLTENEARLRAIVDNIGEAILVVDELATIESMNITASVMFGYSPTDIIGSPLRKLIELPSNSAVNNQLSITSYVNGDEWQEVIAHNKNEQEFNAEYHLTEIRVRQKRIYIVIIRDITQQKLAAERVKESERLFRSSFDHAPIGMALVSTGKKILQVNQSLCKMLGYTEQEITTLSFTDIMAATVSEKALNAISNVFDDSNRYLELESFFTNKAGQLVAVKINLSVMTDTNDVPLYIIAQAQDITDRHRFEIELKTANEQLITRYKELEQNNNETALAAEMSSILQSCLTTSEALEPVQKYAQKIFKETSGILYLTIPGTTQMIHKIHWGNPLANNELILVNDCWALRRGQPYIIKDAGSEICCNHTISYLEEQCSYLCVPLLAQGEIIGLLYVEPYNLNEEVKVEKLSKINRRAISFADQISLALANINLRESLQHQSTHDSLTGLYNRRFLDQSLKLEILRSSRKGMPLSLLMIDVDHFKAFNDKHGHDVGDKVLKEISQTIRHSIRDCDIACRMGGEEFLVILPDTPAETALGRGEEIRATVMNVCIIHGDKNIDNITVSVGVATYPTHGKTAQKLLESVDKALYLSKNNGRNRVSIVAA